MKGVGTARPQPGPAGVQGSGDEAVPTPAIRLQACALGSGDTQDITLGLLSCRGDKMIKAMRNLAIRALSLILFVCVSGSTARAQGLKLQTRWALLPGDRTYLTTGTNQRGLAYNPVTGHLILVNRSGGISVHLLDALTGDDLGVMDTTSVTNAGTCLLYTSGKRSGCWAGTVAGRPACCASWRGIKARMPAKWRGVAGCASGICRRSLSWMTSSPCGRTSRQARRT